MFEKLKQKYKHYQAERKEEKDAYEKAKKEENIRTQHLSMQKKLEAKKQRIAGAKESGIKSVHKKEMEAKKAKERAEAAKRKLSELSSKYSPIAKQLAKIAAQKAARYMLSTRPKRRRRKSKKSRRR